MKLTIQLAILLLFVGVASCFSQKKISNDLGDYLKVKIFEHTRDDIEKLYGKPKLEYEKGHRAVFFLSNGMRVSVNYSYGDCRYENLDWNVPEWKVIEITYSPLEDRPNLKKLISGKIKFENKIHGTGDVPNHIEYFNYQEGIRILFDKGKNGEGVMDIIIESSEKDKIKNSCKQLY